MVGFLGNLFQDDGDNVGGGKAPHSSVLILSKSVPWYPEWGPLPRPGHGWMGLRGKVGNGARRPKARLGF